MRASNLVVVLVALLGVVGCQSVPYQATPIVGDSMTIGGAGFPASHGPMVWDADPYGNPAQMGYPAQMGFQGCPAGGCGACAMDGGSYMGCANGECSPSCDSPYACDPGGMASGGMPPGCAGGFCDGRCHGLCRMAHAQRMAMLREKHEQFQQFVASRPVHTHIHNAATRHCEGAVGPQFGAVQYPYYTTRGPRDFLMANPPSIGP